jgi:hypothetical protein
MGAGWWEGERNDKQVGQILNPALAVFVAGSIKFSERRKRKEKKIELWGGRDAR